MANPETGWCRDCRCPELFKPSGKVLWCRLVPSGSAATPVSFPHRSVGTNDQRCRLRTDFTTSFFTQTKSVWLDSEFSESMPVAPTQWPVCDAAPHSIPPAQTLYAGHSTTTLALLVDSRPPVARPQHSGRCFPQRCHDPCGWPEALIELNPANKRIQELRLQKIDITNFRCRPHDGVAHRP